VAKGPAGFHPALAGGELALTFAESALACGENAIVMDAMPAKESSRTAFVENRFCFITIIFKNSDVR